MRKPISLIILGFLFHHSIAIANPTRIDGMYVNTFGDPNKQAIVFVHGGPGYNSWDFELTTAPTLANHGYFVVVYDQRGQGRSEPSESELYNYKQYSNDLKTIIDTLHLNQPVLLGHSHGGPISIKFDENYPGVAKKIVLLSAPINFFGSLQSILQNCAQRYASTSQQDKAATVSYLYGQLFIGPALPLDQETQIVGLTFLSAVDCGLYKVKNPTFDGLAIHQLLNKSPVQGPLTGMQTAMPGFLRNENYIHFNELEYVYKNRSHFCGLYGDEDGLFTSLELGVIKNTIQQPGEMSHFQIIKGASHAIYLDQQAAFLDALRTTCEL